MDREHYKTENLDAGSKRALFEKKHPVVRVLEEIEEVLMPGEEKLITDDYISLKKLFQRENMDYWHVDSKAVIKIAKKMLTVCKKFADRGITPGFYDLDDIYTNFDLIYICHPERFQLLNYAQDYDWYPAEERLFGDIELLGEREQEIADCRLIYKILVASTRGNVKVPPKMNEADYADLFYQKLPFDLKQFFLDGNLSRIKLEEQLENIDLSTPKNEADAEKQAESLLSFRDEKMDTGIEDSGEALCCVYLILRTNLNQSSKIGNLLYDVQDLTEMECCREKKILYQSFVLGDGNISLRKIKNDPMGFRIQLKNQIKNYSAGETMVIAADYISSILKEQNIKNMTTHRCVILYDGELQNSSMFQIGIDKLIQVRQCGVTFQLISDKDYSGEACQKLQELIDRQRN